MSMSIGTWELPERIVDLSVSSSWPSAVREWELADVEMLDQGEYDSCLCGHTPIRELCHIMNKKNGNEAIVGNHCIKRFTGTESRDRDAREVFMSVPRIFSAIHRIFKDPTANANAPLIEFAERKEVFSEKDANFYHDIARRRRTLTTKQAFYKYALNLRILYTIVLTKRVAFQKLKKEPQGTAGPKLIQHAFEKGVLTQANKDFYMKIWDQAQASLSEKQKKYKNDLNKRIINHPALKAEFDSTRPLHIVRDSTSPSSSQTSTTTTTTSQASSSTTTTTTTTATSAQPSTATHVET